MSIRRSFPGSVVVEGSICVFGGNTRYPYEDGDGNHNIEHDINDGGFHFHVSVALDSAEELDLATGIWKPLPRMPYKTDNCFAFLLSGTEGSR